MGHGTHDAHGAHMSLGSLPQNVVVWGKAPCVRVYAAAYGHEQTREVVRAASARYPGHGVRSMLASTLHPSDTTTA